MLKSFINYVKCYLIKMVFMGVMLVLVTNLGIDSLNVVIVVAIILGIYINYKVDKWYKI